MTSHTDPRAPGVSQTESIPQAASPQTPRRGFWKNVLAGLIWSSSLIVQPLLAVGLLAALIAGVGFAQRQGYFTSAEPVEDVAGNVESDTLYICPMVCVPPTTAPGDCPVCGMELKQQKISGDSKDLYGLTLSPASIRIANIQTTTAKTQTVTEQIRAVGTIDYDQGSLATISAYVDGRIEKLFADYRGFDVQRHGELAVLFSPDLYLSQVGLFQAKQLLETQRDTSQPLAESNRRLYESSRQRLLELGLTEQQVAEIEDQDQAETRIKIFSPLAGTVIEKFVEEGQYVKAGQPILKVADLSSVWLILQLFPEDAAKIRFGQKVLTRIQSLPNREFAGRVAFVDPTVDPATRSVQVRIVIPNPEGLLRIGDFASASIAVDVVTPGGSPPLIHDPELAGKWISPRHPYIQSDQPGRCPVCDRDLVPAEELGFAAEPIDRPQFVTVPRSAVLMVGDQAVAYVETERGRFEYREVEVGRIVGDEVLIESGIESGERVVSKATLLVDSSFNMANKPSLIDPERARPQLPPAEDPFADPEVTKALEKLTEAERASVKQQIFCPVGEQILGSMGSPLKVDYKGQTVWVCCEGCIRGFQEKPIEFLTRLDELQKSQDIPGAENEKFRQAIEQLPPEQRELAWRQEICPVSEMPLGSMGKPVEVEVDDQTVFLCCEACRKQLQDTPRKYFDYLKAFHARDPHSTSASHDR